MSGKEHKGDHQKLKMLYLARIFSEETDDLHTLTMQEIIQKLAGYGVNADRKTLYLDFEELKAFGLDTYNLFRHFHYKHFSSRSIFAKCFLLLSSVYVNICPEKATQYSIIP